MSSPLRAHSDRKITEMPYWPDARGWIGIGVFSITVMLILLMRDQSMREDEFFQTIATVIISNGFMAVVSWAYAATKGGGELADKNAEIVKEAAAPTGTPKPVVIEQPTDKPVPTVEQPELLLDQEHDGELPEKDKL